MRALDSAPEICFEDRVVPVIPAYNEERFIASVVITALRYAEHVIVVDDGSVDRTARIAEVAGAEVIELPESHGKRNLLKSPDRLSALGAQARDVVERRYAWRTIENQYLELYRDLSRQGQHHFARPLVAPSRDIHDSGARRQVKT